MTEKRKKLIVLPALNEGRFIDSIIKRLKALSDAEILLIDDGSTDDTVYKAEKAGVDEVISHSYNRGYGKTLAEGFKYALDEGYEKIVTMDCDEQHEPEMVEKFFKESANSDIVSGSRYSQSSPRKTFVPAERYRINREITRKINKITGYNITDAFCGFKCYREKALEKLNITEDGYGMPLQLWIQAARTGLTVCEIPVALIYHTRESFPEELNNPEERLNYYMRVIGNEKKKK